VKNGASQRRVVIKYVQLYVRSEIGDVRVGLIECLMDAIVTCSHTDLDQP
jgi:hypothetical protein